MVVLSAKDAEGPDWSAYISDAQKKSKCKWSDFGILYRSHFHRDDVVQELAEAGIPFVIESMDISDTPEVRDLFACLQAVVFGRRRQPVSGGRSALLPRESGATPPSPARHRPRIARRPGRAAFFRPRSRRRRCRGSCRDSAVLGKKSAAGKRRPRTALDIIVKQFALDAASPITQAALKFVEAWEKKKINRTTELEELVDYLGILPRSRTA